MRNIKRNAVILTFAVCFAAINFIGEPVGAQNKSAKSTPTPKTKKSPTIAAKTTPKPKAKATPIPKTTNKSTTNAKSKTDSNTKSADKSKTTTKTAKATPTVKPKTTTAKTDKSVPKSDRTATKPKTTTIAPKPTPKDTPNSALLSQIIVATTASRVYQQPRANSTQMGIANLGKILGVSEENAGFYRVEYAKGKSGWIAKTTVKNYENEQRDEIYKDIADKYSKSKSLDFATASEVADFLRTAQPSARKDDLKAELGLKRLRTLTAALKAIPSGKSELFPYRNFIRANEKDVVYSEPSNSWFVRSELYWELHNKYTALPIAEEIAWEAAQNPIPGECEGYVNCYLYLLRSTSGEYLNFYPNGKYSRKALTNITSMLDPIVADVKGRTVYAPPTDISDRAEFNRFLTELRTIISKMPDVEKARTLQQINQLGEGYK